MEKKINNNKNKWKWREIFLKKGIRKMAMSVSGDEGIFSLKSAHDQNQAPLAPPSRTVVYWLSQKLIWEAEVLYIQFQDL